MHRPIENATFDCTTPTRAYALAHTIARMGIRHDRVKQLRTAARLSQQEVARRAGIAQSTYSRIEKGDSVQSYSGTLRALAHALDTTESYLSGETDDPAGGGDTAPTELRVEHDGDSKPLLASRPEWAALAEEVLAANPDIPRDVLADIGASGSMQKLNIPLSLAAVEALALAIAVPRSMMRAQRPANALDLAAYAGTEGWVASIRLRIAEASVA